MQVLFQLKDSLKNPLILAGRKSEGSQHTHLDACQRPRILDFMKSVIHDDLF